MPVERRQGASKAAAESAAALAAGQRRCVLVVFIGGVTHAEVGACLGWPVPGGLAAARMQVPAPRAAALWALPSKEDAAPALPQVSALRFLSQKGLCNCDFIVASTAVCTGSSLLASLVAEGPQQPAAAA